MRYIVFWGVDYYPNGGAKDNHKYFSNYDVAVEFCNGVCSEPTNSDWAHVYDLESFKIVFDSLDSQELNKWNSF